MPSADNIAQALTSDDFARIRKLGSPQTYNQGELIFSDGDNADYIYFIESGNVSIFIEKFTHQEEIGLLGPGEYFGEMAFFSGDRRSASASALIDTTLVKVGKADFLEFYESDREIAERINRIFSRRNEELTFKEHLTGVIPDSGDTSFQLGIKGDPSIRFSAFSRERYDSVVDRILPDLQPRLYDLLMNRSPYEIFIHCNSGEVHTRSVFDPLGVEIHPATKLLNIAYIERHFPAIKYEEKAALIKRIHEALGSVSGFEHLPENFRNDLQTGFVNWKPVEPRRIAATISRLSLLRKIENFYLRNFSISIIRDTVRMQFNCDGTQIVNAHGFLAFLEQNVDMDDVSDRPAVDRRMSERRHPEHQAASAATRQGERRSPSGRRQSDWARLTGDE